MAGLIPRIKQAEVWLRLIVSLPLMILLLATAGILVGYSVVMRSQRENTYARHLALARSLSAIAERQVDRQGSDPFDVLMEEVGYHDRTQVDDGPTFVLLRTQPAGKVQFFDPSGLLTIINQTDLLATAGDLATPRDMELGVDDVRYFVTTHRAVQPGFYLIALETYSQIQAPGVTLVRFGAAMALVVALALFVVAWMLTAPLHRIAERIRDLARQELVNPTDVEEILEHARQPEDVATLALALEQALSVLVNLKRSVHGIIESMEGGIIATDERGVVRYVNSSARTIMGLEGVLAGRQVREIFPSPDDNLPILDLLDDLLDERITYGRTREVAFRTGLGERIRLGVSTGLVPDEDDRVLNYIVTFLDLTDLIELQDRVRQADRLSSLGSMAIKVAHEIRNPLGSVKGLAQLVLEAVEGDSGTHGYVSRIVREVDRLDRIVDDLLDYSQRRPLSLDREDLNEVVKEAIEMARFREAGKGPAVLQELDLKLPGVLIDRNRFLQAILNILVNALQAVGPDGVVTVSTYMDAGAGQKRLALEVADNGPGIAPEDLEHIFDPFFTTKPSGSGLGLSIAHTIIREHESALQVDSRLGRGTTFRILMPRERWEEIGTI